MEPKPRRCIISDCCLLPYLVDFRKAPSEDVRSKLWSGRLPLSARMSPRKTIQSHRRTLNRARRTEMDTRRLTYALPPMWKRPCHPSKTSPYALPSNIVKLEFGRFRTPLAHLCLTYVQIQTDNPPPTAERRGSDDTEPQSVILAPATFGQFVRSRFQCAGNENWG